MSQAHTDSDDVEGLFRRLARSVAAKIVGAVVLAVAAGVLTGTLLLGELRGEQATAKAERTELRLRVRAVEATLPRVEGMLEVLVRQLVPVRDWPPALRKKTQP